MNLLAPSEQKLRSRVQAPVGGVFVVVCPLHHPSSIIHRRRRLDEPPIQRTNERTTRQTRRRENEKTSRRKPRTCSIRTAVCINLHQSASIKQPQPGRIRRHVTRDTCPFATATDNTHVNTSIVGIIRFICYNYRRQQAVPVHASNHAAPSRPS